jgi:hypothetical protein
MSRSVPVNNRSVVSTAFATGLLLLGACSGCPSTPSGPTAITVEPNRVPIFAGSEQAFEASGVPGKFFWSVNGGGTIRAEDTPDAFRAFVTAGTTAGTFQVTVRTADRAGSATFQVVTQRVNFNNVERFVPAPGNVPVPGCRATFVTSYITAEDGVGMRAVLFEASGAEAPAFLPTSAPLAAAGQVQLQGGTTNRTTEAVEIVFSKAGVDLFRQRYAAHYVWPGCS